MTLDKLPPSTQLTVARCTMHLKDALERILKPTLTSREDPDPSFCSYELIEGLPMSGRIFFTDENAGGAAFPTPLDAYEAAVEIANFTDMARYAPLPTGQAKMPGWEIRATCIDSRPAAIVLAAWM